MNEIINDITISNLNVKNTLEANHFIQPHSENVINISDKLKGSFLLHNIQIGYNTTTENTFTIIEGFNSELLSQLHINDSIIIYYKSKKNNILETTSLVCKINYIIDNNNIIIDIIFDSNNLHPFEDYIINKDNLTNNTKLPIEIYTININYILPSLYNNYNLYIFAFTPKQVKIYLPIIELNTIQTYNIYITKNIKSITLIPDNNDINGSYITYDTNLLYQNNPLQTNKTLYTNHTSKSILVTPQNIYAKSFHINEILSGTFITITAINNNWHINSHLRQDIKLLKNKPQYYSIFGIQDDDNKIINNLIVDLYITNNNIEYIESNQKSYKHIIDNNIKLYYNNNQEHFITINKYLSYSFNFIINNKNSNVNIFFFYYKTNNKYINQIQNIYNNNILNLSNLNIDKIYYVITNLTINSDLILIDNNIISHGILNIIDTDNSFYIENIIDKNNNPYNTIIFPTNLYSCSNAFKNTIYQSHSILQQQNINNININLHNNNKGFYKINNKDEKYYPLYFTSQSLNKFFTYGPLIDNSLKWKTQEHFDYFMPDDINIITYNPLHITKNNIIQSYLPQNVDNSPDIIQFNPIPISAITHNNITFTWDKLIVLQNSTRNNIINYIIQSYLQNNWITIDTITNTYYTYNDLMPNSTYQIRIASINIDNYVSSYSNSYTFKTLQSTQLDILPNIITNLQYVTNNNTILLVWDVPIPNNSGNILGYSIDILQNDIYINIISKIQNTYYKISNLLSNTFYKFRIYSHNSYGISSYVITDNSLKTL